MLLIILAAVDLIVLCIQGISLWTYAKEVNVHITAVCQIANYLGAVFDDLSIWLLVLITGERVVIVMWPTQHKERVTKKMLLVAVVVILLASMALRVPDEVYTRGTYTHDNTTITGCYYDSEETSDNFMSWYGFVIRFLWPFVLIVTGNIQLIVKLVLQNRERKRLTGKGTQVGGVTMMLMIASLVFFISVSPNEIHKVFTEQLFPVWKKDHVDRAKYYFLRACTETLSLTNHTLNFFIYFFSGSKFREAAKDIMSSINSKSAGPDKLPYEVLKNDTIIKALHKLYLLCFSTRKVPGEWLRATISPIPKSAQLDKCEPLNYRGISLLCTSAKIYSSILNSRVMAYLENNKLLVEEQNGFRRSRACIDHVFFSCCNSANKRI